MSGTGTQEQLAAKLKRDSYKGHISGTRIRKLQDLPNIKKMSYAEVQRFLRPPENRQTVRPSQKVQTYRYEHQDLMPAAYWAAFHGVIGSVGFNNALPSDLGDPCIKMAEAEAALERFAVDLQGSDGSLSLEEFYPKAFSEQMHRALDIARYGLKYEWRSKHHGL